MEGHDEGYLPPEPSGPEPDVGGGQQQPPQQQPPPRPYSPPYGYPPQQGYPPPQAGYTPPQGYPPPPGGWQQPPYPPQPAYYGWTPPPPQPDNNPAVAGFVLSMVAGVLWLLSAGLSSIVSIVCAILGVVYSRRGKQKVSDGETQKHKDLAQVGLIMGWVMIGLATLSTIAWILVIVLAATDDDFDSDLDNELDDSQSSAIRLAFLALRVVVHIVS